MWPIKRKNIHLSVDPIPIKKEKEKGGQEKCNNKEKWNISIQNGIKRQVVGTWKR